jgi:hypothetical protein
MIPFYGCGEGLIDMELVVNPLLKGFNRLNNRLLLRFRLGTDLD